MKLTQLSVFLENKPQQVRKPCRLLAERGINIRTLTLADTQQFGILRLIVRDWAQARDALSEAGYVVQATEVVALAVPDRPGGLDDVLRIVEDTGVNMEYMYAFTTRHEDHAIIIFRFEDADAAIAALQAARVDVLGPLDILGD